MPVDTQHPQYAANIARWLMVETCCKGAKAVRDAGVTYLPNPDKEDKNNNSDRYKDYVARANYLNVTGRTLKGMVGMAFRNDPEIELTAGLKYMENDADGEGGSIKDVAKSTIRAVLKTGRYGLLADYPQAEEGLTQAQVEARQLRAAIKRYNTQSIINWKTTVVNGEEVLSMVVLAEEYETDDNDPYSHDTDTQYRVLLLDEGFYTVEVWRDDTLVEMFSPLDGNGQRFTRIPFVIAGTYSNDAAVDDPPLYDIAEVNIAHYRNSADYEEGIHFHGQPLIHVDTGTMNQQQWDEANPSGITVGARGSIVTSGGGSANLIQAESNSAAFEAMAKKEAQMISIGARLIEPGGQAETAEAVRIKHAGDNSVLADVVQNVSAAILEVLTFCGAFMRDEGENIFRINEDFYDKTLTAQEVMADIQLYDRNVIGKADLRDSMRRAGRLNRSDEDIDEEVGSEDPTE